MSAPVVSWLWPTPLLSCGAGSASGAACVSRRESGRRAGIGTVSHGLVSRHPVHQIRMVFEIRTRNMHLGMFLVLWVEKYSNFESKIGTRKMPLAHWVVQA